MAKKIFSLNYAFGREYLSGHVTDLGAGRLLAVLTENGRSIAKRDLDRDSYHAFWDEITDRFDSPEYDFNSIWPFRRFVLTGDMDGLIYDDLPNHGFT
ncbi:hypothetical protein [Pseudooceanicola sp. MF1-13]|uniref:hypothetical protein n=1 Tax=Pseudooceanicola sp. MF1-13 TaxID=3379095 RepID=UPI00389284D5